MVLSLLPDAFYRFLAVPNGVAMIGLGYSLWRGTRMVHDDATVGCHDREARQQSPSDDMRSIGDDENAAALKASGGQLTPHSFVG